MVQSKWSCVRRGKCTKWQCGHMHDSECSFLLWIDCNTHMGQLIILYSESITGDLLNKGQIGRKRNHLNTYDHIFTSDYIQLAMSHRQLICITESLLTEQQKCTLRRLCVCICVCSTWEKSVSRSLWSGKSKCLEKKRCSPATSASYISLLSLSTSSTSVAGGYLFTRRSTQTH